jgi:hypothetical protein
MRTKASIIALAVLGLAALGQAQTIEPVGTPMYPPVSPPPIYGGGGGGYPWGMSWSSTAAEGFANGLANIASAVGQYNLNTSAAAVNLSLARQSEINNDKLWTKTYFEMRDINRQQREAALRRERGNPEDWARYAQVGRPKPLVNQSLDAVTGEIRWPVLLGLPDFAQQRAVLEKAFANRAYHGVMGAEDYLAVRQVTGEMLVGLRDRVADLPPQQYLVARRFLESLAFEASQPAG